MAELITKILVFNNFRVREQVFIVIKLNYRTKIIDCRLYFSFVIISNYDAYACIFWIHMYSPFNGAQTHVHILQLNM